MGVFLSVESVIGWCRGTKLVVLCCFLIVTHHLVPALPRNPMSDSSQSDNSCRRIHQRYCNREIASVQSLMQNNSLTYSIAWNKKYLFSFLLYLIKTFFCIKVTSASLRINFIYVSLQAPRTHVNTLIRTHTQPQQQRQQEQSRCHVLYGPLHNTLCLAACPLRVTTDSSHYYTRKSGSL